MNDWNIPIERNKATYDFCAFLNDPRNEQTRKALLVTEQNWDKPVAAKKAYELAKTIFSQEGDTAIPDDVEVRVYEEDRLPRDRLVTIVLPPLGSTLPTWPRWDVFQYYRCTWSPWDSLVFAIKERRRRKDQKREKKKH
jgi:hypothetical protein